LAAIASLLWPIFTFILVFSFKRQIGNLLGRVKRGKLLGQEFELEDSLNKLEASAVAVAEEVAALPAPSHEDTLRETGDEDQIKSILSEAARSPKAALILLASEIEKEARRLLGSVGHLNGQRYVPLSQAMETLSRQFGGLPGHVVNSLKFFGEARNKIVHGGKTEDEEVLRAIDSGVTILKALQAFPREINVVYYPSVAIYLDEACMTPIPDAVGVILETESAGGTQKFFRIFPTTKTHFRKGGRVAWEWNAGKIWGKTWYKDPDTGVVKVAWNSSMEFVGRNYEDL